MNLKIGEKIEDFGDWVEDAHSVTKATIAVVAAIVFVVSFFAIMVFVSWMIKFHTVIALVACPIIWALIVVIIESYHRGVRLSFKK